MINILPVSAWAKRSKTTTGNGLPPKGRKITFSIWTTKTIRKKFRKRRLKKVIEGKRSKKIIDAMISTDAVDRLKTNEILDAKIKTEAESREVAAIALKNLLKRRTNTMKTNTIASPGERTTIAQN